MKDKSKIIGAKSKTIGATIVFAAQKRVYELSKALNLKKTAVEEAKNLLQEAKNAQDYAYRELCEQLDFLEEHNLEAYDDWYAELNCERPSESKRREWSD
jgi:hypothetical protein